MDRPPGRSPDPLPGAHLDVVGDVHGCLDELVALLGALGYRVRHDGEGRPIGATHPGRAVVFVGDLVDRGPDPFGVLRLVMGMAADGDALVVAGNHDDALRRGLAGLPVGAAWSANGAEDTLQRLRREPLEFQGRVVAFLERLPMRLVLDAGRLVVVHAALPVDPEGAEGEVLFRAAVLGDAPADWATRYRGAATVVHGHTPRSAVERTGSTICVDTGCVYGGSLSALRYPEQQVLAVRALAAYGTPTRSIPIVGGIATPVE